MSQGLDRFVEAQEPVYAAVLAELRAGQKSSHWMWFIFPQLRGLGRSPTALFYGLADATEAAAYLEHPLLGPRLRECTDLLLAAEGSAEQILGDIDAMKLRSSMTLFERASDGEKRFGEALDWFFEGTRDVLTLDLLGEQG